MPGTSEGAAKALKTTYERYGKDFHAVIGSKGGKRTHADGAKPKGFAAMTPEQRKLAGSKGGKRSSRAKNKAV